MAILTTALALLASGDIYSSYPVFGDKDPAFYRDARVLVVTDRGPTRELIIQCREGEGVLLHDVAGDVYVDAKDRSHASLGGAIAGTCTR